MDAPNGDGGGEDGDRAAVEMDVANGDEGNWNPIEWDHAAEELTWERLLGLDGSLVSVLLVAEIIPYCLIDPFIVLPSGEDFYLTCGTELGGTYL